MTTLTTPFLEHHKRAGAKLIETATAGGDELALLRDPWGLTIQLCKRARPML